jgi:hypothetical protein
VIPVGVSVFWQHVPARLSGRWNHLDLTLAMYFEHATNWLLVEALSSRLIL